MPSATGWAQPCQLPTCMGPRRPWMCPATLRSHQVPNMAMTLMAARNTAPTMARRRAMAIHKAKCVTLRPRAWAIRWAIS